jgi:hypothetical protein
MSRRPNVDPLTNVLRHVEEELTDSLAKACAKPDVSAESTGEVERLSDTLFVAARQAKAAAGLRQRIKSMDVQGRLQRGLSTPADAQPEIPDDREKPT